MAEAGRAVRAPCSAASGAGIVPGRAGHRRKGWKTDIRRPGATGYIINRRRPSLFR